MAFVLTLILALLASLLLSCFAACCACPTQQQPLTANGHNHHQLQQQPTTGTAGGLHQGGYYESVGPASLEAREGLVQLNVS